MTNIFTRGYVTVFVTGALLGLGLGFVSFGPVHHVLSLATPAAQPDASVEQAPPAPAEAVVASEEQQQRPTVSAVPAEAEMERDAYGIPKRPSTIVLWIEAQLAKDGDAEAALLRYEQAELRELRESMNDPASFSLERVDRKEPGTLCVSFRAANGFGAIRRSHAFLHERRWHIEGGDTYQRDWFAHCVQPTLDRIERERPAVDKRIAEAEKKMKAHPESNPAKK